MSPQTLWSIRVLYVVGLLALLDLTIIIPTSVSYFTELLPQGLSDDEKERKANFYFGLALSLFSLAQAIVGIFGGYIIALLGFKKTFVALLVFSIIGDTLYALSINPIVAIVGRTISGIGSANLGMVFTYIAMVTSDAERHSFMSIARLFSVVGLVFSPGFVYVLSKVDFTIGGYKCTQLNAAGWITDILCLILIVVIMAVLQEVERPKPKEPEEDKRALMSAVNGDEEDDDEEAPPPKKSMPRLYMSWAVVTVFVCSFYNGFTGTSFEFMVTPICQTKFEWTPSEISLFLLIGSIVLAPVILIVMRISKVYKTTERFWIILALFLSLVGILLSYLGTQGRFQYQSKMIGAGIFAVGQTIAMCAYMVLSVSLMPLSSKIVPPESRQVMVPWVNSCLAAGRLVGPMWTQWTYAVQDLGENTEALFGSIMAVGVVCIVFCVVFWKTIIADSWRTMKSTTILFK